MPSQTRLLAVITARGGSKRLPRKNLLPLAGKPLIAWTIDTAQKSGVFEEVLVSTDDPEIAEVSRGFGASVPWLRPADLASDTARSIDVLNHAMIWFESERGSLDGVVLLQPTSPFRSVGSIRGAVAQYCAQTPRQPIASVGRASSHPAWCFRLEGSCIVPYVDWTVVEARSQDLPGAYVLNGAIYIAPPGLVRARKPLVGPETRAFVMSDPYEAVDIDDENDWNEAVALAARRVSSPSCGRQ